MKKRENCGIKAMNWCFGILFLGVFLYFVLGEMFLPVETPTNAGNCEVFSADWVWVQQDGRKVPVEIPGQCDAGKNEVVAIETVLPETVEDNTYLCFRSLRQDMNLYVDGILRQQYSTKDTRLFGKTSAAVYVFLELTFI